MKSPALLSAQKSMKRRNDGEREQPQQSSHIGWSRLRTQFAAWISNVRRKPHHPENIEPGIIQPSVIQPSIIQPGIIQPCNMAKAEKASLLPRGGALSVD